MQKQLKLFTDEIQRSTEQKIKYKLSNKLGKSSKGLLKYTAGL